MNSPKSALGLLPARAGSKGIPGKNLLELAGKPLAHWAATALSSSGSPTRSICSTDSPEIARVAREAGLDVPFMRSSSLASDTAMVRDVIVDAVTRCSTAYSETYEFVILVQASSPTVETADIDRAFEQINRGGFSAVISAQQVPAAFHPAVTFAANETGRIVWHRDRQKEKRRQEWPPVFARTGLVYIFRTEILYGEGDMYGDNVGFITIPDARAIGIDEPGDVAKAQRYFETLEGPEL